MVNSQVLRVCEAVKLLERNNSYNELPSFFWQASAEIEKAAPLEKRAVINTLYFLSTNDDLKELYKGISDIEDNSLPLITDKVKEYYYNQLDKVIRTSAANKIVMEWYANLLINNYQDVLEMTELIK